MSDPTNCSKCGRPATALPWYQLSYNNQRNQFCSRRCLVEFVAPEVSQAIVVGQWIPTQEEKERMSQ